jgi:hypothetical protein
VSLFRFLGKPPFDVPEAAPSPQSYIGPQIAPEEISELAESGEPGIYIKNIHLSRQEVRKGDTLNISIDWVAGSECAPKSYITYIRFDTEFEKGPLYNESYGKVYRKIIERLGGRRFRFRVDHHPLGGIYPPDKWPPLVVIRDDVTVGIPEDIARGVYSISVKLARKTHYTNYTAGDLLTNNDIYSGTVMGKVKIE